MREPVELRRKRILAVIHARGAVSVSALAAELDVSVVTLRRDVEELSREGKLRRGHGVARPVGDAEPTTPVPAPRAGKLDEGPSADGGAVALVVPERHSYLYETLHGARTALEQAGMRIALHIFPQSAGAERPQVERALQGGARGLLIAPRWRSAAEEEADYGWLAGVTVPTVLMERRPRPGSALHALDSVCSDHWYGTHLAVEHLVALGHRRIVLAARNDSPTARSIRAAFAEIAAARPEVEDWAVVLSSPNAGPDRSAAPDGAAPDLAALLRERGATGAVLHGDEDALMLVQRLAESGVRVPQDCSVVAYDDVVAALGGTPLTAVAPPKADIGRAAAELLLHRLAHPAGATGPVRRTELLPSLEVRGSAQRLHRAE
ncbi:substrate-binding domain-containing protein [Streptomyces clavifer]|uniref:substrate-binding domain-containing protein n=1 Tax=Streptomyces TaxID=1883 RepID=UPI0006F631F6|nr:MULTISPECIES: substrate-binding domain-containing protein [unclassified Streptomyces]KQX92358.1 LacI family transcriptional regulator [Streptomyces sp. Root1319]KQZ18587.1 LacI family transcriptional regulator [Streptomyces sp. Root55]